MKEEAQLWVSSKCTNFLLSALNSNLDSHKQTVNRSDGSYACSEMRSSKHTQRGPSERDR